MYVCLCTGTTRESIVEAVAAGASNSRQVAEACGVGRDCGGCLRNVKALVDATKSGLAAVELGEGVGVGLGSHQFRKVGVLA